MRDLQICHGLQNSFCCACRAHLTRVTQNEAEFLAPEPSAEGIVEAVRGIRQSSGDLLETCVTGRMPERVIVESLK